VPYFDKRSSLLLKNDLKIKALDPVLVSFTPLYIKLERFSLKIPSLPTNVILEYVSREDTSLI
jgi:hypothetical protein